MCQSKPEKSKDPMSQLMDECFLVLLFQNMALCEPFHMKMSLIGMKINLYLEQILTEGNNKNQDEHRFY